MPQFLDDATSPWVTDEEFAAALATLGSELPFVLVTDHGAVGDGVTDDTAAVQQALTAAAINGGYVYLPPGTYLISAHLGIASNVTVTGAGAASVLSVANGSTLGAYGVIGASGTVTDVALRDFAIDGNKAGVSGASPGLVFVSSERITIQDVTFTDVRNQGIYFFATTDSLIEGCQFIEHGGTFTGVGVESPILLDQGSSRNRVIGNQVKGATNIAISLGDNTASNDLVIANNDVSDVDDGGDLGIGIGLGGSGAARVTVADNVISTCSGNGIDTGAAMDISVTGNVVKSCNGGIIGDAGGQAVVTGNVVDTTTGTTSNQGISWVNTTADLVIADNYVLNTANTGGAGIYIHDGINATISGNVVKNCGVGGSAAGIQATDYSGITVTGNRVYDTQGPKTTTWGFISTGTSDYITVVGNDFRGTLTGSISFGGSNSSANHNRGDNSDTVASAATVTLPPVHDVIIISGTATITSVTASWDGREVTLVFADAATITDGSNLKLAGNLVATNADTISLVCTGAVWYEAARSVN